MCRTQWGKTGESPALSRNGNGHGRSPNTRQKRCSQTAFAQKGVQGMLCFRHDARSLAGFLFPVIDVTPALPPAAASACAYTVRAESIQRGMKT
jgi:hypothetical protein